jgi:hypothetical protein
MKVDLGNKERVEYEILDNQRQTKDGEYFHYYKNRVIESGSYIEGIKHGEWTGYHRKTRKKIYEGSYQEGKLIGEWYFWNEEGELIQHADLDEGVILRDYMASPDQSRAYVGGDAMLIEELRELADMSGMRGDAGDICLQFESRVYFGWNDYVDSVSFSPGCERQAVRLEQLERAFMELERPFLPFADNSEEAYIESMEMKFHISDFTWYEGPDYQEAEDGFPALRQLRKKRQQQKPEANDDPGYKLLSPDSGEAASKP